MKREKKNEEELQSNLMAIEGSMMVPGKILAITLGYKDVTCCRIIQETELLRGLTDQEFI